MVIMGGGDDSNGMQKRAAQSVFALENMHVWSYWENMNRSHKETDYSKWMRPCMRP